MESIVIEVADATAKKWRMSSQQQRNKISQRMNIRFSKELMDNFKEEFRLFLDEVGTTLQERGLTEDILNDILNDDE